MERKKVALLFVCINHPYWPYLSSVMEDCRKHFLSDHNVDFFVWSDVPEMGSKEYDSVLYKFPTEKQLEETTETPAAVEAISRAWMVQVATMVGAEKGAGRAWIAALQRKAQVLMDEWVSSIANIKMNEMPVASADYSKEEVAATIAEIRKVKNIFPTESIEWPHPTLMRYHLFLQQEEALKEYDYIYYMDADMRVVDTVGEEILGQGLTMAEHPMYATRKEYVPPYEPNNVSTAFIPRLGCVVTNEENKQWFKPLYAAGGFQGGTSSEFITAMKVMKENIDKDFNNNYIAIWNDESHWNKYLSEYKGHLTVLSPSYVYPDSLIEEYYNKVWGTTYKPRIITITKKFSVSKANAKDLQKRLSTM